MVTISRCGSRARRRRTSGGSCGERAGPGRSWRRMPSPVPGTRAQVPRRRPRLEVVLAVAEEGEVVVGQPAQQRSPISADRTPPAVASSPSAGSVPADAASSLQSLGERRSAAPASGPVLDRHPHVAEHPGQVVGEVLGLALGQPARSRCASTTRASSSGRRPSTPVADQPGDLAQGAGDVPAHAQLRVHDQARPSGPCRASSIVTESTRNGMSSVTMSITSAAGSQRRRRRRAGPGPSPGPAAGSPRARRARRRPRPAAAGRPRPGRRLADVLVVGPQVGPHVADSGRPCRRPRRRPEQVTLAIGLQRCPQPRCR